MGATGYAYEQLNFASNYSFTSNLNGLLASPTPNLPLYITATCSPEPTRTPSSVAWSITHGLRRPAPTTMARLTSRELPISARLTTPSSRPPAVVSARGFPVAARWPRRLRAMASSRSTVSCGLQATRLKSTSRRFPSPPPSSCSTSPPSGCWVTCGGGGVGRRLFATWRLLRRWCWSAFSRPMPRGRPSRGRGPPWKGVCLPKRSSYTATDPAGLPRLDQRVSADCIPGTPLTPATIHASADHPVDFPSFGRKPICRRRHWVTSPFQRRKRHTWAASLISDSIATSPSYTSDIQHHHSLLATRIKATGATGYAYEQLSFGSNYAFQQQQLNGLLASPSPSLPLSHSGAPCSRGLMHIRRVWCRDRLHVVSAVSGTDTVGPFDVRAGRSRWGTCLTHSSSNGRR